jgi:sugar/nucleoside kinase (ribokinase family)
MAGFLLALRRQKTITDAAMYASAAAAASIQKFGCGVLDPNQVDIDLRQTDIEMLR